MTVTIGIDFRGASCLVVGGAGGGIGTAMSVAAAQAGATVGIITNVPEHAGEVIERLRTEGARCEAIVEDVTDDDALVGGIARLRENLGGFKYLVNVVGGNLSEDYHRAAEMDMVSFDRVVSRNLRYAVVACRELARSLIASGGTGSIVNVSSMAARAAPLLSSYSAAKAGLEAFSRTAAMEWGPHRIRVNVVSPGTITTPRHSGDVGDAVRSIPLLRRGEPSEVANVAMFLLSDLASYVTGHTIAADGGLSLGERSADGLSSFNARPDVRARFAGPS